MKKLSTLLTRRPALLRQAHLANVAFAYATLRDFHARIARANLRGRVMLRPAAPQADRYWPALIALEASQAVIEEHFTEEDLMDLADVVAFVTGNGSVEITFAVEDLEDIFLLPLRLDLEREGIDTGGPAARLEDPRRQG
jgi:hypothetical protein